MMQAPNTVDLKQLRELHVKVDVPPVIKKTDAA